MYTWILSLLLFSLSSLFLLPSPCPSLPPLPSLLLQFSGHSRGVFSQVPSRGDSISDLPGTPLSSQLFLFPGGPSFHPPILTFPLSVYAEDDEAPQIKRAKIKIWSPLSPSLKICYTKKDTFYYYFITQREHHMIESCLSPTSPVHTTHVSRLLYNYTLAYVCILWMYLWLLCVYSVLYQLFGTDSPLLSFATF